MASTFTKSGQASDQDCTQNGDIAKKSFHFDSDSLSQSDYEANTSNVKQNLNIKLIKKLFNESVIKLKNTVGLQDEQLYTGEEVNSMLSVLNITFSNIILNKGGDLISQVIPPSPSTNATFSNNTLLRRHSSENIKFENITDSSASFNQNSTLTDETMPCSVVSSDTNDQKLAISSMVKDEEKLVENEDSTNIDIDKFLDEFSSGETDHEQNSTEISKRSKREYNKNDNNTNEENSSDEEILNENIRIPNISKILSKSKSHSDDDDVDDYENVDGETNNEIDSTNGEEVDESKIQTSTPNKNTNMDSENPVFAELNSTIMVENEDTNEMDEENPYSFIIKNNGLNEIFDSEIVIHQTDSDDNSEEKQNNFSDDEKQTNFLTENNGNLLTDDDDSNIKDEEEKEEEIDDKKKFDRFNNVLNYANKLLNSDTENEGMASDLSDKESDSSSKESVFKNKTEKIVTKEEKPSESNSEEKSSTDVDLEKDDNEEQIGFTRKRNKRTFISDDENDNNSNANKDHHSQEDSSDSGDTKKKTKKRKRVVAFDKSSEDEENKKEDGENSSDQDLLNVSRKKIKKILPSQRLKQETRFAEKSEKERRKRIEEKQKLYNQLIETSALSNNSGVEQVILDFDKETKEILVEVNKAFAKNLKPYQIEGIKFMYDCTIETVERLKNENHMSGCILAHSMGLGKTFQVVSFLHTIMTNKHICDIIRSVLIIVPLNVAKNWVNEFDKWFSQCDIDTPITIYEMVNAKVLKDRLNLLRMWRKNGGIMIITLTLYSNLIQCKKMSKKQLKVCQPVLTECLLNPGPDMVIIDEGHLLKNDNTAFNKTVSQIHTLRRIILTGTPLQNNLSEYYIMVDFVKPNLLGTKREFKNRFENPIKNGQHIDSTDYDVKLMKKRVHILHKLLKDCIHRCDYNVLVPYLQPKFEYVLSIRLAPIQVKLYRYYLDNLTDKGRANLLNDLIILRLIWSHPALLYEYYKKKEDKDEEEADSLKDFVVDDDSDDSSNSSNRNKKSKKRNKIVEPVDDDSEIECIYDDIKTNPKIHVTDIDAENGSLLRNGKVIYEANFLNNSSWYENFFPEDIYKLELSYKFNLLFSILENCEILGDKILIFSQSLSNLDMIEEFLNIKMNEFNKEHGASTSYEEIVSKTGGISHRWIPNVDYFRIDGKVRCEDRFSIINTFNDPENYRARLMLVSTKAGGLGINLVGANRCIIFDVSWNPSHDLQAIYRIFRYGQTKPVYVYRFIAYGTMENKIYERQIIKQSLSHRVIDEQQIQRHFKASEIGELYSFTDEVDENRPVPTLPKDRLLADMLLKHNDVIISYHEHDSLLENKPEESLTEDERLAAWAEYESEKNPPPPTNPINDGFMVTGNPDPNMMLNSQILNTNFQNLLNSQYGGVSLMNPGATNIPSQYQSGGEPMLNHSINHLNKNLMQNYMSAQLQEYYKYYSNLSEPSVSKQVIQAKDYNIVTPNPNSKPVTVNNNVFQYFKDMAYYLRSKSFHYCGLYENISYNNLVKDFAKRISNVIRNSTEYPVKFLCFVTFYLYDSKNMMRKLEISNQKNTPEFISYSKCYENLSNIRDEICTKYKLHSIARDIDRIGMKLKEVFNVKQEHMSNASLEVNYPNSKIQSNLNRLKQNLKTSTATNNIECITISDDET